MQTLAGEQLKRNDSSHSIVQGHLLTLLTHTHGIHLTVYRINIYSCNHYTDHQLFAHLQWAEVQKPQVHGCYDYVT